MSSLWTIPAFPLLGAALCLAVHLLRVKGKAGRGSDRLLGFAASAFVLLSFGSCLWFVWQGIPREGIAASFGTWIEAGSLSVPLALRLDALSATLCLVITGVGALIHIYSIDYMKGDPGFARYFACLNLFVAAMLLLVLGDNLPLMFVGWEGVGLCSYLLIGFWHEKGWPAEAGQKAFVVNRIGDLGFLIGIFYLFVQTGVVDFPAIESAAANGKIGDGVATLAALLLFAGAVGKSAQIPLYVWLPDAMAGPTPVSALIHAATMVTAGVYLVCRMSALFALSSIALPVVAVVGAGTALFAATMALVDRDIKKVLAYSTISQLGFMFLGAGTGGFHAATFHLVTHAFFKALLFLGAGSVIHAMGGEQDIFKMGGLRKKLPATHAAFLIGALALAGCPPLSGFFSKDAILWHAVDDNTALAWTLWVVASLTALMTAFYSLRLYLLVFHGKERWPQGAHPHESPFLMTAPLQALLVLAAFGGMLSLRALTHSAGPLDGFLAPVFQSGWALLPKPPAIRPLPESSEIVFVLVSAAIAAGGIALAFRIYRGGEWARAEKVEKRFPFLYRIWSARYWMDELYQFFVVSPLRLLAIGCSLFDLFVIDGCVNLVGSGAEAAGGALRRLQTGHVQAYALWMGFGAALLLAAAWAL